MLNSENYINKSIVVQGVYYSDGDIVASPTTDPNNPCANGLNLDLSKIDNITTDVQDGIKYNFYGKLEWVTNTPISNTVVILRVTKVTAI